MKGINKISFFQLISKSERFLYGCLGGGKFVYNPN